MRVAVVLGTRPEVIKLAPVIHNLERRGICCTVIATGQHREMLDQMLERFAIIPDVDLNVMRSEQDLAALTARLMSGLGAVLREQSFDWLLVQGDTTSAFCGALAAFYAGVRVGHVEAGLRTGNLQSPYPEEANRKLIGALADIHFCPTAWNQENLAREGISPAVAPVVGNTVIDALLWARRCVAGDASRFTGRRSKRLLVTLHRRESQGEVMKGLASAVRKLADDVDVEVLFPMHKSPLVRQSLCHELDGHQAIKLEEPLDYFGLVKAMSECHLVLTDSGGIQEEAPTLRKPVLVLRETTERPEGIAAGVSRLVGTDPQRVYEETRLLLEDEEAYATMAKGTNPYGDGTASESVVSYLQADADAIRDGRAALTGRCTQGEA